MKVRHLCLIIAHTLAVVSGCFDGQGEPVSQETGSLSSQEVARLATGEFPLTPEVLVFWIARPTGANSHEVLLVGALKGAPGWHDNLGGTTTTPPPASAGQPFAALHTTYFIGADTLSVTFEQANKRVTVEGHEVNLDGANVLLISGVGSQSLRITTRTVASLRSVSGTTPPEMLRELAVRIREAPELREFLGG